jgi:hypothetical protein
MDGDNSSESDDTTNTEDTSATPAEE